jgi:PKD repeat protein
MAKPKKKSNIKTISIIVASVVVGMIVLAFGWSTFGDEIRSAIGGAEGGGGDNETDNNNDKPPVAILTADKTKTTLGDAIFFDGNSSYDPGYSGNVSNKGIKFFVWDFGYSTEDGTRAVETTTNSTNDHTFPEARSYIVKLTVIDEAEQEDTAELNITIVPQNLTIGPVSQVLIGQAVGPISLNNMTEVNWTLKSGATSMNISISISGYNFRDFQQNKVEVYLENPYLDVIENETVEVMGQKNIDWLFGPSDLKIQGMYNLVIRAVEGAALVGVTGSASYL